MYTCGGSKVYDVVRSANGLLIVFDDDDAVAFGAQQVERSEQLGVVARVQANRRLVEHVTSAAQVRAQLSCETHPLRFPSCQGVRSAVQREIAEADSLQEAQPVGGLRLDGSRKDFIAAGEPYRLDLLERPVNRQCRKVGDRHTVNLHR